MINKVGFGLLCLLGVQHLKPFVDFFPNMSIIENVRRAREVSTRQKEMLVPKAPNGSKQENVAQNPPNLLTKSKSCAIIRMFPVRDGL